MRNLSELIKLTDGIYTGLQVAYYVGQDQYLDFVQGAGVRIVIHGQNETVFLDANGFNMPSGYQSTAAMKQV